MSIKDQQEATDTTRLLALAEQHVVDVLKLGEHGFRVYAGAVLVDYWPRTGTWRTPTGTKQGTGFRAMLDYLGVKA